MAKDMQAIPLAEYPQLRQLAWHLSGQVTHLSPEDAFALYERQWRHVDAAAMSVHETALLAALTASVGRGVLLV